MTAVISKAFGFSASHRLSILPPDHKCHRLHGHNYVVIITLTAMTLDGRGMVLDYAELKPFGDFLKQELDHRHLGDGHVYDEDGNLEDPAVLPFTPTAENLASYLLNTAVGMYGEAVSSVVVKETSKTSAKAIRL